MSGSAYLIAIVIMLGVVLTFVASPIFLVPAALLVLAILFAAPLLTAVGARTAGQDGAGTPTTSEATYDPVASPDQRQAV